MSLWNVLYLGNGVAGVILAVVAPWIMLRRYANTKPWWMRFALAYECIAVLGIASAIGGLVPAAPVRIIAEVIALIAVLAALYVLFAAGRAAQR
jgi:VIT1/CCC1 family predicted Fe2+/Mn2+ transporter